MSANNYSTTPRPVLWINPNFGETISDELHWKVEIEGNKSRINSYCLAHARIKGDDFCKKPQNGIIYIDKQVEKYIYALQNNPPKALMLVAYSAVPDEINLVLMYNPHNLPLKNKDEITSDIKDELIGNIPFTDQEPKCELILAKKELCCGICYMIKAEDRYLHPAADGQKLYNPCM